MILITGCDTYLGKMLTKRLIEEGNKVRCIGLTKPKDLDPTIEFIQGDLLNIKTVTEACRGIESVFHFLDIKSTRHNKRKYMKEVNIQGTKNLLVAAEKSKVSKFFYLSSYAVYGRTKKIPTRVDDPKKPVTKYGKDKLKAEKICWQYMNKSPMAITIFRPALTVGKGINNPVILILLLMALGAGEANKMYIASDGDTKFQLIHPDDVVNGFMLAFKNDISRSKIYNFGSDNVPTQMEQLVRTKDKARLDFTIKHISPMGAKFKSRILRPFKVNYFTKDFVYYLLKNMLLDCQIAKKDLGWEPEKTNIDILLETFTWYKDEKL